MKPLIKLFWSICLLRRGPDDVPYLVPLLAITWIINLLLGWVQFSYRSPLFLALFQSTLVLIITTVFCYTVLYIKSFTNRFVQTLTALMGTTAVINLLIFPLIILQPYIVAQQSAIPIPLLSLIQMFYLLAVIIMNVWLIMVMVHIFSLSLEVNYMFGLALTIALLGLDIIIFTWMFT